ncbi:hypothetical protein HanRHA438_Chr10g0438451 [Helianthus annuus]|nr:hypothetical protein HanRHA438_Chr10g0438451 [Helianthus annuus]
MLAISFQGLDTRKTKVSSHQLHSANNLHQLTLSRVITVSALRSRVILSRVIFISVSTRTVPPPFSHQFNQSVAITITEVSTHRPLRIESQPRFRVATAAPNQRSRLTSLTGLESSTSRSRIFFLTNDLESQLRSRVIDLRSRNHHRWNLQLGLQSSFIIINTSHNITISSTCAIIQPALRLRSTVNHLHILRSPFTTTLHDIIFISIQTPTTVFSDLLL